MGERLINPNLNVLNKHNKVNILNPYRFVSGGGGLYPPESLVWEYTTTSSPQTVKLAYQGSPIINVTIDWGDGSPVDTITDYLAANNEHTYASAGSYTVEVNPVVIGSGHWGFVPSRDNTYFSEVYMTKMIHLGTIAANYAVSWDACVNMDWTGSVGNMNNNTVFQSSFSAGLRACQISTIDFSTWKFPVNSNNMFWAGHGWSPSGISEADFTAVTSGDIGITTLFSFTTAVYDEWLQALYDQNIVHGVTWNFGTSKYSSSMQSIRDYLVNTKNLTISDGGVA